MPYDLTRLQSDIAQLKHDDAGFGTGRLVAENLILTAAHTLWNKEKGTGPELAGWQVRLTRDRRADGWRFRRGNRVIWHDHARDLALILLVDPEGGPLRPELRLRVARPCRGAMSMPWRRAATPARQSRLKGRAILRPRSGA
jgi:hypothetical protein